MRVKVKIVRDFFIDDYSWSVVEVEYKKGNDFIVKSDFDVLNIARDSDYIYYINEFNGNLIKKVEWDIKELTNIFLKTTEIEGYKLTYITNRPTKQDLLKKIAIGDEWQLVHKYLIDKGMPYERHVKIGDQNFYLIKQIEKFCDVILNTEQLENWMIPFIGFYDVENKVKEKVKYLTYLRDKNKIDNKLRNTIQKYLQKVNTFSYDALYVLGIDDSFDVSPYYNEYLELVNNIIEIEYMNGYIYVNQNDKVWDIKVPDSQKGIFIGKRGANVKKLAKQYGVKINVF